MLIFMRIMRAGLTQHRQFRLSLLCALLLLQMMAPANAQSGKPVSNELAGFTFTPQAGTSVSQERPVITIVYPTAKDQPRVKFETVRLWINEQEVSGSCLRTPSFMSYQPLMPLTNGPVIVTFKGQTIDSLPLIHQWSFAVELANPITSVTHNATKKLGEYEELTVVLKGTPHAKASFEIQDYRFDNPMQEVSPGVYQGVYQVRPKDNRLNAIVIGQLEVNNHIYRQECPTRISLWGQLFRVVILEPAPDSLVPLSFKIKGRTRPNSRIIVTPKIGFSDGMSAPSRLDQESDMSSIPGEADSNGYFEVEYGFIMKLPSLHVVLSVNAVDPQGNHSIPAVLRVQFK